MSKRIITVAKAQYEHELSALEGKWEETSDLIRNIYLENAAVGVAAADKAMFSDEAKLRVAKKLFAHKISDGAGETAPEIIKQCESAAEAVFVVMKAIADE